MRIDEVVPDFRREDVWDVPATGGPDDFGRLVALVAGFDPTRGGPGPVRALFAIRLRLGALLGWDRPEEAVGTASAPSLQARLPADLRGTAEPLPGQALPFRPLYATADEWAAEAANRTMHGVLHLSWVPDGDGLYRGRLAVYVKPNGRLGRLYMAAIKPFRHLIVYPQLMRAFGRRWEQAQAEAQARPQP